MLTLDHLPFSPRRPSLRGLCCGHPGSASHPLPSTAPYPRRCQVHPGKPRVVMVVAGHSPLHVCDEISSDGAWGSTWLWQQGGTASRWRACLCGHWGCRPLHGGGFVPAAMTASSTLARSPSGDGICGGGAWWRRLLGTIAMLVEGWIPTI
jgi:hypothetical protein